MEEPQHSQERDADLVGAALKRGGRTLAVAESLTGGLLASAFARASGSSEWFRGGIVAYSSAVKYDLLDVPGGPVVSEAAAVAMARAAGRLLNADVAVAVTGVGGPDPHHIPALGLEARHELRMPAGAVLNPNCRGARAPAVG